MNYKLQIMQFKLKKYQKNSFFGILCIEFLINKNIIIIKLS
jgi:hypothetical protein